MSYTYYTEPIYFEEKVLGRTTVASVDQVRTIGQRFTELSAQGWEFVRSIDVPVVGKVFKSEERRSVAVADADKGFRPMRVTENYHELPRIAHQTRTKKRPGRVRGSSAGAGPT